MKRVLIVIMLVAVAVGCMKDPVLEPLQTATKSEDYGGVIVATDGCDTTGNGSIEQPFQSLQRAITECGSAGGLILLRGGDYCVDILAEHLKSLTIAAYPDEKVRFVGVEQITTEWSRHSGNIWVTTPTFAPWQLFENREMLIAARWPNFEGYIEDEQPVDIYANSGSIWDQESTWIASSSESTEGVMISGDEGQFRSIGYSVEGAMAVLNIGSFKSTYACVTSHSVGSDRFSYDTSTTSGMVTWQKPEKAYFYLEGKLDMLDRAGEWFYDVSSNKLYLWAKGGGDPNLLTIEGKKQSFAIQFDGCSGVTISGVELFGTTLKYTSSPLCTIANCTFSYPSVSRRALGEGMADYVDVLEFDSSSSGAQILNNVVQYTEGEGLRLYGGNSLVENNYFKHIDYSCVNLKNIGCSVNLLSDNNIFRGNTVAVSGASETLLGGTAATIYSNEIYSTSHFQNDGTMLQFMTANSIGSRVYNNWFHDSRRTGVRVDGEKSLDMGWVAGDNQTCLSVYNNIFWDCNGMMIKGDYHLVVNNTIFSSEDNPDLITTIVVANMDGVSDDGEPYGGNHNTMCFNNIADLLSSYYTDSRWDTYDLSDGVINNYVEYYTQNYVITDVLMDYVNNDFRPVYIDDIVGASVINPVMDEATLELYNRYRSEYLTSDYTNSDIGAIAYNTTTYSVPGYSEPQSSSPIPADGALSSSAGLMLAWRAAYNSSSSTLYFGLSRSEVESATKSDSCLQSSGITNGCYYPSKSSYPLSTASSIYYWRVDDLVDGEVVKGTVWQFSLY
ncbi:MAG: right-handed parallel beta-helix repeat-containing protein [Rikenellaceae bacterium]